MNRKEWKGILESRLVKISNTLDNKSKEYSSKDDVLHNFKRAAVIGKCTPETALIGMWRKHLVSVLDIVEKLEESSDNFPTIEVIDEKLRDSINYLILLEGLLVERYAETII